MLMRQTRSQRIDIKNDSNSGEFDALACYMSDSNMIMKKPKKQAEKMNENMLDCLRID